MAEKQETQSVTLRIPIKLLEQVGALTTERRNRSQTILDLLEKALSTPAAKMPEQTAELKERIESLESNFDTMIQVQDKILHRLKDLERTRVQSSIVSQSKTTKDIPQNLSLLPEESVDSGEPQKMSSAELLTILRKEEPQKGWSTHKLRYYREGRKKNNWHQVGSCQFRYSNARYPKDRPEHYWSVIYSELSEGQPHQN